MKGAGYLVLADISGYTAFVAQTEIDHSGQILEDLTRTVVDEMRAPLRVQEIEGDAVFAYAHTGDFDRGIVLLEGLEAVYAAFRGALDNIAHASTCTCKACGRALELDLKFVVHHGEFVARQVGAHSGIGGADVILAHRLLKNTIRERHGLASYAFFTTAAVERMGLRDLAAGLTPHDETYEHLGRVEGVVHDLAAFWESFKSARDIRTVPDDAFFTASADLPVAVPLAWEFFTNPHHRKVWLAADDLDVEPSADGRYGRGAVEHCVHGKETAVFRTVDWKPMRYVTQAIQLPLGGHVLFTFSFEPSPTGTRVSAVYSPPQHDRAVQRMLLRALVTLTGRTVRAELAACMDRYCAMLRQRAAAGDATPPVAVAG